MPSNKRCVHITVLTSSWAGVAPTLASFPTV